MKKNNGRAGAAKESAKSTRNRTHLHSTRNNLPEKIRSQVCDMLNQALADTFDLYSQVKQAHWNVKGMNFYQLHLMFDEMAEELIDYVDTIAERITALGGTAMGTARMAARGSALPELSADLVEGVDFVGALADRFSQYGGELRQNIDICTQIDDMDTADLFTEVSRNIDKRLWFLEAHLQGQSAQKGGRVTHHVAARPMR